MWYERYIGWPYKFGGRDSSGVDCLTLMILIAKERFNIDAAPQGELKEDWAKLDRDRYWKETLHYGALIPKIDHTRDGDLVLFRFKGYASHAGFMVDNNKFIHILDNDIVRVDYLRKHPWKNRFWGGIRIDKRIC